MKTIFQAFVGAVLKFIWTKIRKKVARFLIKLLLPGYEGTRCDCGDAEKTNQATRNIEVSVKVDDQVVTVKIANDSVEDDCPETRALADRCRLPVHQRRLIQLLRMDSDS